MIRDIDGSARQTISQKCNVVYEYLRQCAAIQPPPELIQKFKHLLQNNKTEDPQVSQALENIVSGDEKQFYTFLSQCFYTIFDSWLDQPESLVYLNPLLKTLDTISQTNSYNRRRKHLVQIIKNYQQSESYQQLKLLIVIINPPDTISSLENNGNSLVTIESSGNNNSSPTPIVLTYLIRYPYLYQYYLPQDLETPSLIEFINQLQRDRQQDFEILLSKHIIYRFRLRQLAKMKMMAKGAGKMITKAENPSLLSERAFRVALNQYLGKIDQDKTLLERSQRFLAENEHRQTYRVFKQDLYHFLTSNIKPRNNTYQFSSRLKQKIVEIFPQANDKPLNRTHILQTCRQLYSFLVIDPASNNNPAQFAELVANLGTAQVMMILVKIVLICPESKADLEKKIYWIATHYQHQTITQIPWLLKSLEHLLIAFSIYFGQIDVSIAKSAVSNT